MAGTRISRSALWTGAALMGLAIAAPTAPAGGDGGSDEGRLTPAVIDAMIAQKWEAEGLTPSERCSDTDFLRRAYLDLTGSIPTFEQTEAFLADSYGNKRGRLIDQLLAGDGFAEYWAMVFERVFIGRGARQQRFNRPNFRRFLRESIKAGKSYDQLVREMLLATGDTREVGAVGFGLRYEGKPNDVAGAASRALLGVQLQCAQCHDHPYEDWKQEDFRDFSAYFANAAMRPIREPDPRNPKRMRNVSWEIIDIDKGQAAGYGMGGMMGRLKKAQKYGNNPRFRARMEKQLKKIREKNPAAAERLEYMTATPRPLGSSRPASLKNRSRREAFVDWITAPSNPWFGRALVNRVWSELFGRGFVNPVDDFSPRNPASHPELLNKLSTEFVRSGYDLRKLITLIMRSDTYQRSSEPSADNDADDEFFSRGYVTSLTPEQILNSVFGATAMLDGRPMLKRRREFLERIRERILQQFIITFDTDEGDAADAFEGSVPQALMMLNGTYTNSAKGNAYGGGLKPLPNSTIGRILLGRGSAADKIRKIYIAVLVRQPSATELARCQKYMEDAGRGIPAFQDIFWALLNSTEFIVTR